MNILPFRPVPRRQRHGEPQVRPVPRYVYNTTDDPNDPEGIFVLIGDVLFHPLTNRRFHPLNDGATQPW